MKNITLSAGERLVDQARLVARSRNTTLNAASREWLVHCTSQASAGRDFDALMKRLSHVKAGRRFSREETNER